MDRVGAHVEAFNHAVTSGDYTALADRFTEDAVMSFAGVPVGPFLGRQAILAAYRSNPPDDTMTVLSQVDDTPTSTRATFRWSAGGTGTMIMHWSDEQSPMLAEVQISFDAD
jgi:hypothetical protein